MHWVREGQARLCVWRGEGGYWEIQRSWFARVNALCNLSRKKSREVAAHFRADFWVGVASRCLSSVWLCERARFCVEVFYALYINFHSFIHSFIQAEHRIAKQYKCQYCCSCKNYCGKGMEGGNKVSLRRFFGWPKDREFVDKMPSGASYSTNNKLLLIARHIMTTGLQKCLCKIRKFTVTAFHCEESTHRK